MGGCDWWWRRWAFPHRLVQRWDLLLLHVAWLPRCWAPLLSHHRDRPNAPRTGGAGARGGANCSDRCTWWSDCCFKETGTTSKIVLPLSPYLIQTWSPASPPPDGLCSATALLGFSSHSFALCDQVLDRLLQHRGSLETPFSHKRRCQTLRSKRQCFWTVTSRIVCLPSRCSKGRLSVYSLQAWASHPSKSSPT